MTQRKHRLEIREGVEKDLVNEMYNLGYILEIML